MYKLTVWLKNKTTDPIIVGDANKAVGPMEEEAKMVPIFGREGPKKVEALEEEAEMVSEIKNEAIEEEVDVVIKKS